MKITFVLPSTPYSTSGGIRVVCEYANQLRERGHIVNVVYPLIIPIVTSKNRLTKYVEQAIGTVYNLLKEEVNLYNLKTNVVRVLTINPKLARLNERLIPQADIIVATAWETAYMVNKVNAKKGKKFYLIQHYEVWDMWNDEAFWKKAEEIEPDAGKICLAMHKVIPENKKLRKTKYAVDKTYKMPLRKIVISSWLRELMEKEFGENVEGVITNGVNLATFHQEKVEKTGKRILMPFRSIKWKGTEDGLKAFSIVREKHPQTEFAVYGAGSHDYVPNWIRKYGRISDDKLRKLYSSSDIFVLSSLVEGCQLPPMEAMACGCAVVATNVGGILDYAVQGKTVLVSPPRKPEMLANNIIKLLDDRGEMQRISTAGHDFIKQFTWERATSQLEKIFAKHLDGE
jgi:glycosyltransferase involved in cell wall biosynthesis